MRPRMRKIEAQVAAKRLSKAEAQRRIQRIRKRVQARLARSTAYKPTVAIAEQYLGLSPTALRDRAARRPHALAAGGWDRRESPPRV